MKSERPELETATCRSQVQRHAEQGRFQGGQGGRGPSEISAPPPVAHQEVQDKAATCQNFHIVLGSIRTESLLCISCHFNAFMFCDILMIYITY